MPRKVIVGYGATRAIIQPFLEYSHYGALLKFALWSRSEAYTIRRTLGTSTFRVIHSPFALEIRLPALLLIGNFAALNVTW